MKNITLINPSGFKAMKSLGLHSPNPPIGLAYIAAILKSKEYKYKVIDMTGEGIEMIAPFALKKGFLIQGLSIKQTIELIPEDTDIIGISCLFSIQWIIIRDLIAEIKNKFPKVFIVSGGEHITAMFEYSLQNSELDAVVMGEGEKVFIKLIDELRGERDLSKIHGIAYKEITKGNIVLNKRAARIDDLNALPWPDWDSFPIEKYIEADFQNGVNRGRSMPLVATRGCPFQCTFCSSNNMWGRQYRMRNPMDIIAEMKTYMHKYKAVNFNFQDLTAFVNKKWVVTLSEGIVKQNLKISWQLPSGTRMESFDEEVAQAISRAGCRNIAFAPESASSEIRKAIKKDIDFDKMKIAIKAAIKHKVNLCCFFVIGFPQETKETLKMNLRFIRQLAILGVCDLGLAQFVPYPGSDLYRELSQVGEVKIDDQYLLSSMDFYLKSGRCYAKNITSEELYKWQIKMLINFYLFSAFFHPLRALINIAKAVFLGKEETRYAKFITEILYRRPKILLRSILKKKQRSFKF